jgi:hypothetical protein
MMIAMKPHVLLVTAILSLPALPASAAEPVERLEIVDKAIAFHGGELYRASETELDVCSLSGCFHVRALVDGDRFDYEVSGKAGRRERRVRWTGEELARWEDGAPAAVEPGDAQGLRDWVMARVYFAFLPYRLNDPSVFKEDLGRETWDGRELHKVKVTFAPGSSTDAEDEYLYWFDPESGRVEQFAYSFQGRPGGLRFRRAVNHRRVGGVLFSDQENLGVEGDKWRVDEITPSFVEGKMRTVSVVRFENVEVRPLR